MPFLFEANEVAKLIVPHSLLGLFPPAECSQFALQLMVVADRQIPGLAWRQCCGFPD